MIGFLLKKLTYKKQSKMVVTKGWSGGIKVIMFEGTNL